ncbi:MAG: D-tyrosyl-tRNA(Tyr) deacylase [Clostridia bacterium]|nr:D-tyrosyl-tRNA(Tyr) deacylase [Clostridia bacterium]
MKAVLQRVTEACVRIDGVSVGKCGHGLMILLGVAEGDSEREAEMLAKKISSLRIFSDENGKMNRSCADVGGEILVVSQFTLLANYRCGNRPDYKASAAPDEARRLYEYFSDLLRQLGFKVENGVFGADMQVSLVNDGPVTIIMDTDILKLPRNGK